MPIHKENIMIALRQAIQEGIESGIADDFNPESNLESLKAKKKLLQKTYWNLKQDDTSFFTETHH